jgi:hypothetical protein
MKCRIFVAALFVSLFAANGAYAQNKYYLSHVANGNYGPGSFRMTFILFNNGDTDTTALLELTNDNGLPLIMTITGLGAGSQFTIQLPAGASQILQTDGLGSLVSGAAVVTSAANIGVSAIFTIYDNNGNYVTESGVGSSAPLASSVLPVDTTGSFNTGLALFNFSGVDATITLILRDTNGQQVATAPMTLRSHGHTASFIAGVGQLFPSFTNFQGTLLIQSSVPIAAMVLRQNLTPLSYTSLPVVSTSSTKQTLNLAHVATGSYAGGSFKTSFLIFNISASPANVVLALTQDNGTPFSVTLQGRGTASSFTFNNLAPGGSLFLQTDGSGVLSGGAATITSNVPVGASGVFTVFNTQGAFQTESGVGDSPVLTSLTLPVDVTGNFDTGVAFYGPSGATLTFRLLSANGTLVGSSATRNLAVKGHLAEFVSQIFPGTSNFRGSVAITATSGVAALTLRQNSSPLSYTTLPVGSGTASGKTPAAALLSKTDTGITATSNVTLNETLPAGFKLTGTISGPGQGMMIIASASQSSVFAGTVDPQTGKYLVVLAAGVYNLTVGFKPNGVPTTETLLLSYAVPNTVQVSADTTRDITLPAVTLFTVSGTVTGLGTLPSASNAQIVFTSNDNTIEGELSLAADGSYQGPLPSGSYVASLRVPSISFSLFQNESLEIYNLGSASISGNVVLPAFAVPPTARLSGTISGAGLTLPIFGANVTASDTSAPLITQITLAGPPAASSAGADLMTGQYQMILARNRMYDVNVSVPLMQGATTMIGILDFPVSANIVSLNQDTVVNFSLPALPGQVTISGRVTDGGGQPVSGVGVAAFSQSITGATNLGFTAGTQTDANGNYSIVVLSGTNYQVIFVPPTPTL